jgi:hypothetical protein
MGRQRAARLADHRRACWHKHIGNRRVGAVFERERAAARQPGCWRALCDAGAAPALTMHAASGLRWPLQQLLATAANTSAKPATTQPAAATTPLAPRGAAALACAALASTAVAAAPEPATAAAAAAAARGVRFE